MKCAYLLERGQTFTTWHSIVPHNIPIFENAGDSLRSVGLHEPLLTQERDGAAKLQTLTKALSVYWNTRVGTFVVPKRCRGEKKTMKYIRELHANFDLRKWAKSWAQQKQFCLLYLTRTFEVQTLFCIPVHCLYTFC